MALLFFLSLILFRHIMGVHTTYRYIRQVKTLYVVK